MNTLIENYRGFEIIFNTESERFSFTTDEGSWKEKQSYSACKKNIDDYLKLNAEFKPFKVRHKRRCDNVINIIGIRKDNRFIIEDENGVKSQLSDYNEEDYILIVESDNIIFNEIEEMEKQADLLQKNISDKYTSIDTPNLKSIKHKYAHTY